nr:ribonuclease H-like domain-containing protein [Tanacetum cinerariifolium]
MDFNIFLLLFILSAAAWMYCCKAFRVYNLETKRVEENLHVNFIENKPNVARRGHAWMFDLDYLTNSMNYEPVLVENQAKRFVGPKEANNSAGTQANDDQAELLRKQATHVIQNASTSNTNLINTASTPISIVGPSRAFIDGELSYLDYPSMPHLEDIYASPSEAIFTDLSYDHEGVELLQFEIQKIWILVDLPFGKKVIGTKWVYRNKKDERGV